MKVLEIWSDYQEEAGHRYDVFILFLKQIEDDILDILDLPILGRPAKKEVNQTYKNKMEVAK